MEDICEHCEIDNCEECPLWWNDNPCNDPTIMLDWIGDN